MLSAVFMGKNLLEVKEMPVRRPGPDEVMIKVAACGVCGTDLHIYGGDKGAADCPPGTILGHEFSGIIEEIGSQVTGLKVGDRVSVDPNDYCGHCYSCRNGKAHFCENMVGIGTTVHGGFAEYCTFRASQAYRLPDALPLDLAALAEPVGCCLHGIDLSRIKPGDTVLVIGAGTIGLIMLQLAKISGAARTIVMEPIMAKHAAAFALGADFCINPREQDVAVFLRQQGLGPIDVAIECVGKDATVLDAIRLVGQGGTVMMFGLTPPDCEIPIKPFEIFQRELHLTASFINPYTMQRALNLISSDSIHLNQLIGARVPLKNIREVFEDPSYRQLGKILIEP